MNEQKATSRLSTTFIAGLWRENPVFRLLLGMCPTLAVTAAVKPALTMGLCVIFVLLCSNIVVSLMRNLLKPHLRILMFTLAIATFVTIVQLVLEAYLFHLTSRLVQSNNHICNENFLPWIQIFVDISLTFHLWCILDKT